MTSDVAWVRTNTAYRAVVRRWPGRTVLACSGGVDSSALLVLAGIAVNRAEIEPFIVAHVDHHTRAGSAAEGEFVERLAGCFGLRAIRAAAELAGVPSAGSSPEDRLRTLRYMALARVAADAGVDSVVTAHTRNDQVETILMRLLSGAGGLASAGMTSGSVVTTPAGPLTIHRPLLGVDRHQLDDVLRRVNVVPLNDPTNGDRRYRRNAVRHDIVPQVQQAFPGFESALLRTTMLARRDAEALDTIARERARSAVDRLDDSTRIDRATLRRMQPAIAARVIRDAAGRLMPAEHRELSFERIESVRVAANGRTGAVVELPHGVVALVERDQVVLERRNRPRDGE